MNMHIMNRRKERGGSIMEFALIMTVLGPMIIGVGVLGIDMIRTEQTTQLAREAGYMFSHGIDFSEPGNLTILANIGAPLGLSTTAGSGSAEVILSALIYVDDNECSAAGAVDADGNPSGCNNFGKWVFAQRLVIGNSSVRSSSLGSPLSSGPTGVTIDSTTGLISPAQYATQVGAVATFNSVNPYSDVDGVVTGLPSRQYLFIAEAAGTAFTLPPFSGMATYSYGLF
jgi:hypothetical protein